MNINAMMRTKDNMYVGVKTVRKITNASTVFAASVWYRLAMAKNPGARYSRSACCNHAISCAATTNSCVISEYNAA
jgi:hypothetical protein